jgi:hypothetical protein
VFECFDANFKALPTLPRSFSFENWPVHKKDKYKAFLEELNKKHNIIPPDVKYFGSDISYRAVKAAQNNAQTFGSPLCEFFHGDFEKAARRVPDGAWIMTNMPYDLKISSKTNHESITGLYRRFSKFLRRRKDLTNVFVLARADGEFRRATRPLAWTELGRFSHGGTDVQLWRLGNGFTASKLIRPPEKRAPKPEPSTDFTEDGSDYTQARSGRRSISPKARTSKKA